MRRLSRSALGVCAFGLVSTSVAQACLVTNASGNLASCMPGCGSDEFASTSFVEQHHPEGEVLAAQPLLFGLPGGGESAVTVHVLNFDYSTNPSGGPIVDPTISVGDTVHWVFDASFHSVTSVAGSAEVFDSTVQFSSGATFDHVFTQAGTYQYYCTIHGIDNGNGTAGLMSGTITVLAVPEPTSVVALALPLALLRRR